MTKTNLLKICLPVLFGITSAVLYSCKKEPDKTPPTTTIPPIETPVIDSSYFDTGEQCRMAVDAMYITLSSQLLYQRGTEALDMLSDDAEKGGSLTNVAGYKSDQPEMYAMALYDANATNRITNNFWKEYYRIILQANSLIDLTADRKDVPAYKEMRAEARFLRAFVYMDLVKMFGAVPLITSVIPEAKSLSNREFGSAEGQIAAIYNFITSELEAIKGVLPQRQPNTQFGRANDAAVRAYLAKAYLYAEDFAKAYATAKELITTAKGNYGLEAQYHKVFDFDKTDNEYTIREIVFAIQYVSNNNYGNGSLYYANNLPYYTCGVPYYYWYGSNSSNIRTIDNNPRAIVSATGTFRENTSVGYGLVIPTKKLVDAFETGDPRLDMIAKSKETAPNGIADSIYWDGSWQKIAKTTFNTGNYTLKNYLNQAVFNGQLSGKDYILMRWAEVLLIGAEAAVRTGNTGDATAWVNELRERARNSKCTEKAPVMAGYKFSTSAVPANLTTVSITDVKKERQKELFCENGTRYFDLLRWNKTNDGDRISADEILSTIGNDLAGSARVWKPGQKGLFPIPIDEIRAHNGALIQNTGY